MGNQQIMEHIPPTYGCVTRFKTNIKRLAIGLLVNFNYHFCFFLFFFSVFSVVCFGRYLFFYFYFSAMLNHLQKYKKKYKYKYKYKRRDLYLMHWPLNFKRGDAIFPRKPDGYMEFGDIVDYLDTWKAMEKAVDEGLVKHIGISNFNAQQVFDN